MRANVLNDAALVKQAGQFAWLSIDSEKPVNAGFVAKFATGGVPLFLVIDAGEGTGRSQLVRHGDRAATGEPAG